MKYCQGTLCHTYKTKDRIRGTKGDKHYETRRNSRGFYNDEFCSLNCKDDWLRVNGKQAIDHFGRVTEAKRTDCDNAWYKDYKWISGGNHEHYFANYLLGQRIPITQQQYNDKDLVRP